MTEIPDEIAAVILTRDGRGCLLAFHGDGLVKLDNIEPGALALVAFEFAQKALAIENPAEDNARISIDMNTGTVIANSDSAKQFGDALWAAVIDAART